MAMTTQTADPATAAGNRSRLRRAWDALRAWQPSMRLMRIFAWAALVSNALISVTGAVVRVTGSGLGCSTWPDCHPGSLVPESRVGMAAIHQAVEFGNRTITGPVLIASLGTFVLIALLRPARRQLLWLALVGPIGVVFQAVWGGITVHMGLAWWTVMPHLLVSLVLVFFAAVVVVRLHESDAPPRLTAPRPLATLTWITAAVLAAVTVSGTIVTATGPHAGDAATPRLGWDLREAAQLHADLMFLYLGLIAALGVALVATHAPRVLKVRIGWLIGLTAGQGALGMVQYFLGVPEAMVVAHVALAVVLVAVAAFTCLATRERTTPPA
jgi:cytochrome c oxidase assembly protein subunit 15